MGHVKTWGRLGDEPSSPSTTQGSNGPRDSENPLPLPAAKPVAVDWRDTGGGEGQILWFDDCVGRKEDNTMTSKLVYPGRWPSTSEMDGNAQVSKIGVSSTSGSVEFEISSTHPTGTCVSTSENRGLEVTGEE